jgi:hypothetical protein
MSKAPRNWRVGISNVLTNMDAPMPLPRKLYLLSRNVSLRLLKRSTCCGHDGQPGC